MEIPVINRSIISNVTIIHPSTGEKKLYPALWDTGAQETAITEKVVKDMGLYHTGQSIQIEGINDSRNHMKRCYAGINVGVGSSKRLQPIIIQNRCDDAFDVVIGMDIIENLSLFSISSNALLIE
jgi:predicted aspartyl protease